MKNVLQSKTIWIALLIFVASVLSALKIVDLPLSPDAAWMGIALSVIQVILRLVTKSEVNWTGSSASNTLKALLILLLPVIMLTGCSSGKNTALTKIIFKPDSIVQHNVPASIANLTDVQIMKYDSVVNTFPDNAYITGNAVTKHGTAEIKYYPKKNSLASMHLRPSETRYCQLQQQARRHLTAEA